MSSWSTAVLQAVVSDRRARVFNRSGATAAVTLDISKTFDLTNASLMDFQVDYLNICYLFSVTDRFSWFLMGCLCKNIQLMMEFIKVLFLFPLLLPNINGVHVICIIAIIADSATVCSKCEQLSGLWQQVELTYELESDLQDRGRKWVFDFSAGQSQHNWVFSWRKIIF